MTCPKCGFPRAEEAIDCARCGIVFSKWTPPEEAEDLAPGVWSPPPLQSIPDEPVAANGTVGAYEWKIIGIGFVAAIVAQLIPITRWGLSALKTLFHEIGHAVVAWSLGQPAIPAFDFAYGGGFTNITEFQPVLALFILGGLGWIGWRLRSNRRSLILTLIMTAGWLFIVTSEWRRETVIASAGVLFELILAAVFFYMALSGRGWRIPEIERPLGAFAAFFVLMSTMIFAWRLGHDVDFMSWYLEGKGGALMNDLEIVALNLHIRTSFNPGVAGLATMLFVFSPITFLAALLIHLKHARISALARELVTV